MSAFPATVPQRVRLFPRASPHNPASFLQEHPDVTVVCDRAAAADLRNIPTIEKPHA
jgi:hypothetical protein